VRTDRLDDDSRPDSGEAPVARGADGSPVDTTADTVRGEPAVGPDAGKRAAGVLEHRTRVDTVYRAYAIGQGHERVREIEEKTVTPAMRRIEAEDPGRHLAGLEHRLKGKDRLTEKVTFDVAKKGVTVEQALGNVKDAIRYALCYPDNRYTEGVVAVGTRGTRSSTKESTAGGASPAMASYSRSSSTRRRVSTPRKRRTGPTRSCGRASRHLPSRTTLRTTRSG
jgi:hypothetical protein